MTGINCSWVQGLSNSWVLLHVQRLASSCWVWNYWWSGIFEALFHRSHHSPTQKQLLQNNETFCRCSLCIWKVCLWARAQLPISIEATKYAFEWSVQEISRKDAILFDFQVILFSEALYLFWQKETLNRALHRFLIPGDLFLLGAEYYNAYHEIDGWNLLDGCAYLGALSSLVDT